jgi:hypothetical protein
MIFDTFLISQEGFELVGNPVLSEDVSGRTEQRPPAVDSAADDFENVTTSHPPQCAGGHGLIRFG